MVNEFKNVIEFNNQVIGLTCVDYLSKNRLEWFKGVINEELGEFEVANNNYIEAKGSHDDYMAQCCRAEMADALIDLIYFAYGRLYEIGIFPEAFEQMWSAVHQANMKKKKGNKGRGSDLDAVKPEGWEAPEKSFFNQGELSSLLQSPEAKSMVRAIDEQKPEILGAPTPEAINRDAWHAENVYYGCEYPYNPQTDYTKSERGVEYRKYKSTELYGPIKKDIVLDDIRFRPGTKFVYDMETLAAMPKAFIEATQLCMKKSQDYNNGSNKPASRAEYFPFGALSYAQMLHTKTQRLNSLVQQTKKPNNESIRDTLLDLINYSGFAVEAIDKGEI